MTSDVAQEQDSSDCLEFVWSLLQNNCMYSVNLYMQINMVLANTMFPGIAHHCPQCCYGLRSSAYLDNEAGLALNVYATPSEIF